MNARGSKRFARVDVIKKDFLKAGSFRRCSNKLNNIARDRAQNVHFTLVSLRSSTPSRHHGPMGLGQCAHLQEERSWLHPLVCDRRSRLFAPESGYLRTANSLSGTGSAGWEPSPASASPSHYLLANREAEHDFTISYPRGTRA